MKNNRLIIILSLIGGAVFLYWLFSNDSDITKQVKELNKENALLKLEITELNTINDSLISVKKKEVVKYVYIKQKLKDKEDETNIAINNVRNLNERVLDSTIRNYKHPTRN